MINLFNPKQTTKIGFVKFTNSRTKEQVELPVYDAFWSCAYQPNIGQILVWLLKQGHVNVENACYVAVM